MNAVRESSKELMARLVQTLLDEGVTAQTFDLDAMPFAAMEMFGHEWGKVLARQIQAALAEAQAAWMQEQHGEDYACPQWGQACRAARSLGRCRRSTARSSVPNRSVFVLPAGSLFVPPREVLQIARETFSPGGVKKVILATVETKSFSRAEAVMAKIAEVEISGRHIGRLAHSHGERLIDPQRQRVITLHQKQLAVEVENAPELAVVELDGGRIRTRAEGQGPGTHEPAWKETKNALFLRMSSAVREHDPCPELPETLQNRRRIRQLVLELSGSASGVEEPPIALEETSNEAPERPVSPRYDGPQKLLRTCLSSLDDVQTFGPLMKAEAHRKAFFPASRQAFVADGMLCNGGGEEALPDLHSHRRSAPRHQLRLPRRNGHRR